MGALSQMKLTSFEKNCHILRRSFINSISKKTETITKGKELILYFNVGTIDTKMVGLIYGV